MKYEIKDYSLELIDEPTQKQVVAWEKAARALKTEDARPILNELQSNLRSVNLESEIGEIAVSLMEAMKGVAHAIRIINENESLTLTANHGVMVKAAMKAGWFISLTKAPAQPEDTWIPVLQTPEDVENSKPWLITWCAEQISHLYLEATSIPKK